MGWFSSKSKQDRNNDAYAEGFKTRENASPVERMSYNVSMSLFAPSNSTERAFNDGYKEADRRTYAGDHSKKS